MDEKQARYIVAILGLWNSSPQGIFWEEATEVDYNQYEQILVEYNAEKWKAGFRSAMDNAKINFILRIANNGIPDGATLPADVN